MEVHCPNCGEIVVVKSVGGRKPLNIPLTKVYDALRAHKYVAAAAQDLQCSPAYVFGVLKQNGKKLEDVLNERSSG